MAPLTAIHRSAVPPSGASLAVACTLAPPSPSSSSTASRGRGHLVTARNNVVRVYEVVQHGGGDRGDGQVRVSRDVNLGRRGR